MLTKAAAKVSSWLGGGGSTRALEKFAPPSRLTIGPHSTGRALHDDAWAAVRRVTPGLGAARPTAGFRVCFTTPAGSLDEGEVPDDDTRITPSMLRSRNLAAVLSAEFYAEHVDPSEVCVCDTHTQEAETPAACARA
jgi:hypothetical protein